MVAANGERLSAIKRWCATTSGTIALREGVLDRVQSVLSFDCAFFATVDPATLLYTSGVRRHMPAEASPAFLRTELGERDVNQLRDLATATSPVGWLDGKTDGDRTASRRYLEAMRPVGLGDELRVALRIDGACWGLLCLHRGESATGFSSKDASLLAAIAPALADSLRRAVVVDRVVEDVTADGPGVAVVAPDFSVEAATPSAERWLADLAELDAPRIRQLPTVVRAVVEREAAAPEATATHGRAGCFLCLSDMSSRPLRPLADGGGADLGTHRLRWLDTPHVPGPWEAGVVFDETTRTLFCGDLFSRTGRADPTTTDDVSEAAIAHEQLMHGHAYTPGTGPTLRRLAGLEPQRLALMHGPTFCGDGATQLGALADYFDACLAA